MSTIPKLLTPGVSTTYPPPDNGNISAKVVVCFPESCASEITAVFNPKPGSTRFSNEDFPTPDKPATAVTFPANSAFTSSTPSPVSADTAKQTYPTCS